MQKVPSNACLFLCFLFGTHICVSLDAFAEEKFPEVPTLAPGEFDITSRQYVHGNVKISVTNAKRRVDPDSQADQSASPAQNSPMFCAAWMVIHNKNGNELSRMVLDNIDPLGGNYGLFVLPAQPSKDLFIIVFHGNYDDKFVVIDKDGKTLLLTGTGCFQTRDKRYLITQSLGTGYAILDLRTHVPVTSESVDGVYGKGLSGLGDIYYSKSIGYFSFYDPFIDARPPEGKSTVYILDPATGKIASKEIDRALIKSAEVVVTNLDIVINGKSIKFTDDCTCG